MVWQYDFLLRTYVDRIEVACDGNFPGTSLAYQKNSETWEGYYLKKMVLIQLAKKLCYTIRIYLYFFLYFLNLHLGVFPLLFFLFKFSFEKKLLYIIMTIQFIIVFITIYTFTLSKDASSRQLHILTHVE